MNRTILACLVAACCGLTLPAAAADALQSLRGQAAVDDPDPSTPVFPVREGHRYERNYPQQPPLIPHRIDKYEIDLKVNQCLRCHDWPNAAAESAPMVSLTHYDDRGGGKLDKVAGQRWFCTQCHTPQVDAPSLVRNTFRPAVER